MIDGVEWRGATSRFHWLQFHEKHIYFNMLRHCDAVIKSKFKLIN